MSRMRVDDEDIRDAEIFEILLDNFPDIIHSVDDDGTIVFTNKKAESLLGYTREELVGMNVRDIYADEILAQLDSGFANLKEKGDVTIPESMLKAKDGTRIPVEIRSFSIYDDNGQFLRTFSILRDIRPIKQLQNDLVHAGRLAAIGEMASGVAHDINNPLTAIVLANDMLSRRVSRLEAADADIPAEREQLSDLSGDVKRASQSIRKLVDHLRNFARGIAEAYEPVNLRAVIEDSLFITNNKINRNQIDLENGAKTGSYMVKGSPNQLEQVIINLVSNACDAMTESCERKLVISVTECDMEGVPGWKLEVSDTGEGISDELKENIFKSFYTTKEKGKGTGLGLSISRGIIREHGGEIEVESEPGKGTTFSIRLPKLDKNGK